MSKNKSKDKLSSAGRINRRQQNLVESEGTKPWWQTSRRKFIVGGAVAAGAVLTGGVWLATRDDTTDVDKDSLELQRAQGWNIGSEQKTLSLPGQQTLDSQQGDGWKRYLDQSAMLGAYQPKSQAWLPFFVPTLIQSLQFESLRQQLAPVHLPDMRESYGRGQTIARDFLSNAENAGETAIIVDLPGRDSVALGAGMADAAELILTFDNFPHPLGVTPSHETLAAMIYYAGEIEAKQTARAGGGTAKPAPVFLLDSKRLEPYKDADTQFDNRYLAKLPSAQKFQEMGVKSVVYVTADRTRTEELDDLNEDFVEYKNSGLNVAMLPLSDLVGVDESVTRQWDDGSTRTEQQRNYYYGGSPGFHPFFFYSYPFYRPYPAYARRTNFLPGGAAAALNRAPSISPPGYAPTPRPTMFSGTRIGGRGTGGVGRSKPSGFGRATVRVAPSGGVVGTRAGRSGYYSPGRSGSFGRSGGGGSGG
jgi:hypothetical protein